METAKITVCIPTYNRLELLKRSIDSVLNQSMPCVLIHVFDNASTDGTEAWMTNLVLQNPRVKYVRNAKNYGAIENVCRVIASAETPYFVPLADDDWLLPESLKVLLETMEDDPSLGAVVAQTTRINSVNGERWTNPNNEKWEFRYFGAKEIIPALVGNGHFEWSSILFSTSASRAVGGYRTEVGLPGDQDLQIRLFWHYPVKLIEQQCAVWNLHPFQSSGTTQTVEASCGILKMVYGMVAEEEIMLSPPGVKNSIHKLRKAVLNKLGKDIGHTLRPAALPILKRFLIQAGVPLGMRIRAYVAIMFGVAGEARNQFLKPKRANQPGES